MQSRIALPIRFGLRRQAGDSTLTRAQRAIADWARVDDYCAVLDLDCQGGTLLQYYLNRFNIRACGIAGNPEDEQRARATLADKAEVLRAKLHDIPWESSSFDAVLMPRSFNSTGLPAILSEITRVMKPGAQFILAVPGTQLPAWLGLGAKHSRHSSQPDNPYALMDLLSSHGFHDVSMRSSRLGAAAILAHTAESLV